MALNYSVGMGLNFSVGAVVSSLLHYLRFSSPAAGSDFPSVDFVGRPMMLALLPFLSTPLFALLLVGRMPPVFDVLTVTALVRLFLLFPLSPSLVVFRCSRCLLSIPVTRYRHR